jgi:hypothetical protein
MTITKLYMLTEFFKYLMMMMMMMMAIKTLVVLLHIMHHVKHVYKSVQPFHIDVTNQVFNGIFSCYHLSQMR